MTTAGKSSRRGSQEPGGTPTFDPFTALWPTPSEGKQTRNRVDRTRVVNSDGTPWIPGRKQYDSLTGKQIQTNLADYVLSQSISSAEGHLVSPSATLDEGWEREMTVTSGRRCFGWYGNANLGGSFSRTCLASLLTRAAYFSPVCRLTWRMQATKSSRLLYFRLWPSVRRIGGTEFSLWPRPKASADHYGLPRENDRHDMARTGLWPTATSDTSSRQKKYAQGGEPLSLATGGRLNPAWVSLLMGAPADWCISTSSGNAELRGLGNAVVPQVAEHLGRMIMEVSNDQDR